jgi:DNA-binding transcriptional LysR family regulator
MFFLSGKSDYQISRQLKLRDLSILAAVIESGSMAKAAQQLRLTQPAISQSIAELEQVTGFRLLERSTRGVTATAFGIALAQRGAQALDAVRQSLRDLETLADPASGEVWVGTSESYIAGGALSSIIKDMAIRYPRIAVHVSEANTAAGRFEEVRDRRVDLMIGRLAGPVRDDDLDEAVLLAEAIQVVAGMHNPLARKRRVTLKDLVDEKWILAPPRTAVNDLIINAFRAQGLPAPALSVTTYSMQLRMQLLASGRYLTALPVSAVRFNAARWSLKALPIPIGNELPVSIVTLKAREPTPAVRMFMEQARKFYGATAAPTR